MSDTEGTHMDTNHDDASRVGVKDAATMLGVHANTVRKLHRDGRFATAEMIAGRWTFTRADVEQVAAERAAAEADRATKRTDAPTVTTGPTTMALQVLRQWEAMQERMAQLQQAAADANAEVRIATHHREQAERAQLEAATEAARLRERVAQLEADLAAAPKRRRWFGRDA